MTKIERRRTVVTLYQGNVQQDLADLYDEFTTAVRDEATGGQRRASTKSKAAAKATEYDKMLAEAEATAAKVVLLEIPQSEYQPIADEHPPREGNSDDAKRGVNMKTFPGALLRASIADRELDLDALSPMHFNKLGTAAWNLHNADDAFPKSSLVLLLKQAREPDSKPPSDSA